MFQLPVITGFMWLLSGEPLDNMITLSKEEKVPLLPPGKMQLHSEAMA